MIINSFARVALAASMVASCGLVSAAPYTLSLVDFLPTSINNSGQSVGTSYGGGSPAATTQLGNTITKLGSIGGSSSAASAINNAGQIVGTSDSTTAGAYRATIWNGFMPTDLGTLGGPRSVASGINAAGQVVGWSDTGVDGTYRATLWDGATITDLGTLGGPFSAATGINDAGQVVGTSWSADFTATRALAWNNGVASYLADLDGGSCQALGINNSGSSIGYCNTSQATRAVLWNGTAVTDLGTLGGISSFALAINSLGQVVGGSYAADGAAIRATRWNDGMAEDLNTYLAAQLVAEGWVLESANGINDMGSIVGVARNVSSNDVRGFILTTNAVPEPGTYTLVLASLGLLAGFLRSRSGPKSSSGNH